jgi:hypothetical protein
LDVCDFNAPQVYWNAGAAGKELRESYRQYELIKSLPFIPAGRSYYGESGFPNPTSAETTEFLTTSQELGCPAAFFWSADALYHKLKPLPEIVDAIGAYKWIGVGEPIPPEPPDEIPSGNHLMVVKLRIISIENKIYENDNPIWLSVKE